MLQNPLLQDPNNNKADQVAAPMGLAVLWVALTSDCSTAATA